MMRPYTSSSGPPAIQEKSDGAVWSRMGIDRAAGATASLVRGCCPLRFLFFSSVGWFDKETLTFCVAGVR